MMTSKKPTARKFNQDKRDLFLKDGADYEDKTFLLSRVTCVRQFWRENVILPRGENVVVALTSYVI